MALVPRGRNATALAEANAYDFDARISFVEESHRYYIDKVPFTGPSVTKIKDDAFGGNDFDPDAAIAKNWAGWKEKAEQGVDAKYPNMIRNRTDEEAFEYIKRSWKLANELGTLLHAQAELYLNDMPVVGDDRVKKEFEQFLMFMRTYALLKPIRTELSLFYTDAKDNVVAVGQLDALFQDPTSGEFCIVDFKRTDKELNANIKAYQGKTGVGLLADTQASDFYKYSLQQSLYSVMYEQRTGVAIKRMFLLALHPSATEFKLALCADMRGVAKQLLDGLSAP